MKERHPQLVLLAAILALAGGTAAVVLALRLLG